MIQNALHELATAFRSALESAVFDAQHGSLRDFPDRCCDHASILFAIHLLSEGHGPPRLVYASRGTEHERRHVWLIVDGFIVDLAADQFEGEGQPRVIVAEESEWHDEWTPVERDCRDFNEAYADQALDDWYRGPYRKVCLSLKDLGKGGPGLSDHSLV